MITLFLDMRRDTWISFEDYHGDSITIPKSEYDPKEHDHCKGKYTVYGRGGLQTKSVVKETGSPPLKGWVDHSLTVSELQKHAINQIGCKLSDEELQDAIKMIIYGMSESLDAIVNTAVAEATLYRTIVYDA